MILGLLLALLGTAPVVRVGLERVEADGGRPLLDKRVGLVAHAASVTADGRHAVEVLRGRGVNVRRLFGPEHGLRGTAAAGEKVESGTDAATGLPVVSLYGDHTRPRPEDLAGLDVLVVDLQDAGVRFYTYASTMLLCLDAAAEAGIELVVLDRPNPLGGARTAGPLRDPAEDLPVRLVNMAPGPLVHGLTLGEMARYANSRRESPARLTVVEMSGWKRWMTWADTGRRWVPPSPNLRTAEAALVYPGTGLVEATNVSEGRGAESPFVLVGAPWLRTDTLLAALKAPGLRLEPVTFVPTPSPAAREPKHSGERCQGFRIHVTDTRRVRPYAFGISLLIALRSTQPEVRWTRDGEWLDTLLGTRRVRRAIERGDSLKVILAADLPGLDAFARERMATRLY